MSRTFLIKDTTQTSAFCLVDWWSISTENRIRPKFHIIRFIFSVYTWGLKITYFVPKLLLINAMNFIVQNSECCCCFFLFISFHYNLICYAYKRFRRTTRFLATQYYVKIKAKRLSSPLIMGRYTQLLQQTIFLSWLHQMHKIFSYLLNCYMFMVVLNTKLCFIISQFPMHTVYVHVVYMLNIMLLFSTNSPHDVISGM